MHHFPRWKIFSIMLICLLAIALAMPNILSSKTLDKLPNWWPKNSMNLGLDLRGGSHLLLAVDFPHYFQEQLSNLKDNIRRDLRKDKIGYIDLAISQDKLSFNLRDQSHADRAEKLLKNNRELEINRTNNHFVISYKEQHLNDLKKKLIDQSIEIIRRRVDETGTKEPIIQSQGEDKILLQVPGLNDPEHLKKLLGQTAKMTFHLVNENVASNNHIPFDSMLLEIESDKSESYNKIPVYKKAMLNGDLLSNAMVSFNQYSKPVVAFEFNHLGAKLFGELTKNNIGKRLAIVLDNKVICAPSINEPIMGGSGTITGNYTAQTANDLALLLRAGALPAPLKIIEERTVGPSLGAESIEQGKLAAFISVIAVILFMLAVYGIFGLLANIALCLNLILLVALLSLLQATLTLPGIAGIVLTMGMSVDANVLIFERIREESRNGLSTLSSLERGFNQAFNTIIDSNLTTILVAIFLYVFGSGAVKGFAVTLVLGILTSMFSAITLTRLMMSKWVHHYRPKSLA
jgi:preprotein translocase subunit SecD